MKRKCNNNYEKETQNKHIITVNSDTSHELKRVLKL